MVLLQNIYQLLLKNLYKEVNKIHSRTKDTLDILNVIDMIICCNILTVDSVLVNFDIFNMLPSIDSVSGLEAVSEILENRKKNLRLLNVF